MVSGKCTNKNDKEIYNKNTAKINEGKFNSGFFISLSLLTQ